MGELISGMFNELTSGSDESTKRSLSLPFRVASGHLNIVGYNAAVQTVGMSLDRI